MKGLILCSKQSDTPYRIPDADLDIYSIEEFAYYLYNNAYFVDESFFNEALVSYIEHELGLPKVAMKLTYEMENHAEFYEMVMTIINASMYYEEEEKKQFEKELKVISSKGMLERMWARAGMLLQNGKYGSAKKTLLNILENHIYKKPGNDFYAEVYNALGKIECRMFYFDQGIEAFQKALELDDKEEYKKSILFAKLTKAYAQEQEADVSEEEEVYPDLVAVCREEWKDYIAQLEQSDAYKTYANEFLYDGRHNLDDYYEHVLEVLEHWKNDYREDMM